MKIGVVLAGGMSKGFYEIGCLNAIFDFFGKEDLPLVFPEFAPYLGACRYTKCTHTKEEGCAVLAAVREGKIAKSRHDSFLSMYAALKDKHDWEKK